MRTRLMLCLVCVIALSPVASVTAGDDEEVGAVVLADGSRIQCGIVDCSPRLVHARIGSEVYALERAGLREVQAECAKCAEAFDPDWLALVRELAPLLVHHDERLAHAARVALASLGSAAEPYFDAVSKTSGDDVASALAGIRARTAGTTPSLERQVEWARRVFKLRADQEQGFREALAALFKDLRTSGDRAAAWARYRETLNTFLTADQRRQFDEAVRGFEGNR